MSPKPIIGRGDFRSSPGDQSRDQGSSFQRVQHRRPGAGDYGSGLQRVSPEALSSCKPLPESQGDVSLKQIFQGENTSNFPQSEVIMLLDHNASHLFVG